MSWFPVRMRSQLIIGFIFVPDEVAVSRRAWVLPVREQATTQTWSGVAKPTFSTVAIHLKLDDYGAEIFIDAEEFPLDLWRRVAGFLEVTSHAQLTTSTTVTPPKTDEPKPPTVRKRKRLELDL